MFKIPSKLQFAIIGFGTLAVGFASGWWLSQKQVTPTVATSSSLLSERYELTRPILFTSYGDNQTSPNRQELQGQISQILDQAKNNGTIDQASVYYRSFADGSQMLVNA